MEPCAVARRSHRKRRCPAPRRPPAHVRFTSLAKQPFIPEGQTKSSIEIRHVRKSSRSGSLDQSFPQTLRLRFELDLFHQVARLQRLRYAAPLDLGAPLPSGLMIIAHIHTRIPQRSTLILPLRALDHHLHAHRHEKSHSASHRHKTCHERVRRADVPSLSHREGLSLPPHQRRRAFDYLDASWILQPRKQKLQSGRCSPTAAISSVKLSTTKRLARLARRAQQRWT